MIVTEYYLLSNCTIANWISDNAQSEVISPRGSGELVSPVKHTETHNICLDSAHCGWTRETAATVRIGDIYMMVSTLYKDSLLRDTDHSYRLLWDMFISPRNNKKVYKIKKNPKWSYPSEFKKKVDSSTLVNIQNLLFDIIRIKAYTNCSITLIRRFVTRTI